MKNILVFVVAVFLEIAGCFAFWAWLRNGRSPFFAVVGVVSLIAFATALTRADTAFAGRAYAAYGGIYIAASLVWLWRVASMDATPPLQTRQLGLIERRLRRRHAENVLAFVEKGSASDSLFARPALDVFRCPRKRSQSASQVTSTHHPGVFTMSGVLTPPSRVRNVSSFMLADFAGRATVAMASVSSVMNFPWLTVSLTPRAE